jgi:hypothetical protein
MNKIFKSILFLLLPVTSFCNEGDSIRSDKFQYGISYAPEVGYRTLKTTADYAWSKEAQDQMGAPKFGFSAGVNFGYKLSTRLTLEIKALYADKGYQTKERIIESSASSPLKATGPYKSSILYSYRYLDIPFKLNYYLVNKKIKLYVTAGVSANIFINEQTTAFIKYRDGRSDKVKSNPAKGAQALNFSALAGFGFSYNLTDHNVFRLEPVFNYSITPLVNAPVKNYLYTASIRVGITHTF